MEHVAKEADVLVAASPDDHGDASSRHVLGELDPVPVRVEDVDEPDLAVQLEHDADLDPRGAEPFCLGLHVGNLDVRDAAVLDRLALRERDLHLAVAEARPGAFVLVVGLLEPERLDVEPPRRVEVADAVPDGRRHEVRGRARAARAAASGSGGTRRRRRRRSHGGRTSSVRCATGRTTTSPSTATGCSLTWPTARIAACGGLSTAVKRSIPNMPRFEIVKVPPSRSSRRSLPSRARPTRSARAAAISAIVRRSASRTTGTISPFGAATAMPTCAVGKRTIALAGEVRVHGRVPDERRGDELRQQVVHGRLRLALAQPLDERRADGERGGHVGGDLELEDRRLPGLGQAARDRLPRRGELDRLRLAGSRRARRRLRGGRGCGLRPRPARRPRRRSGRPGRCRGSARGRGPSRARSGGRAATP